MDKSVEKARRVRAHSCLSEGRALVSCVEALYELSYKLGARSAGRIGGEEL